MNKQELLNKLAAKQAAAEQAATKQTAAEQTAAEQTMPENTEILIPLKSFTIHWSEAGNIFDGVTMTNWEAANNAMQDLWNMVSIEHREFYHKTKVTIEWIDGSKITDRLDLGTGGDFNPDECTIQDYIKEATSAMYESNLQKGERKKLSWSDEAPAAKGIIEQKTIESDELKNDIPQMLRALIGIVETIEEAEDTSEAAKIKACEQVEKCEFYIFYLQKLLPILKEKTSKIIDPTKQENTIKILLSSINQNLN